MSRNRESGLNVSRRRRKDGSVVEYFYDRETKQFLGNDRDEALRKIGQVPDSQPAQKKREDAPEEGTFAWLIDRFLASPKNNQKWQPRTKRLYEGYLGRLRADLGDLRFADFGINELEEIQIAFQAQPRKCNQIVGLLRQMLNYAVRQQLLRVNPLARPGMLPTPARDEVWSEEDENKFLAVAPPELKLAFMLLLYTCQRPGDVLAMTKGQVTERRVDGRNRFLITLRQQKTSELVAVMVHEKLEPLLKARIAQKDSSLLLIPSPRAGKPWSFRNFARKWDIYIKKAGLDGKVQRRDLRRTGVVRLASHGASVPLLASVTGWGVDYCQRIVDTYLPRRTELAIQAMLMWEKGDDHQTVVKLPQRVSA